MVNYLASTPTSAWTNASVLNFAEGGDPIELMTNRSRELVLNAIEDGWQGPPFDVFALAKMLGYPVVPCDAIRDARLTSTSRERGVRGIIEYNPNQPSSRIRFSVAHEIAHTLFSDWREETRNRVATNEMVADEWQLEMLCNIGASEILMPVGSFRGNLDTEAFSIDSAIRLQKSFEVSIEALLQRIVRLSRSQCSMFAASSNSEEGGYVLDYFRHSSSWNIPLYHGMPLPGASCVNSCVVVGYTAKCVEKWSGVSESIKVEGIAVSPYPGFSKPRIVGLLQPPKDHAPKQPTVEYLTGDALSPRGSGTKIIAHVVNDRTANWGAGFALAVGRQWPDVQDDFRTKVRSRKLVLGNLYTSRVRSDLHVAHMVAQHGYGHSAAPRIRYQALEDSLKELALFARAESASVHMPRIGCGHAGGNWNVVEELIDSLLCKSGISVTVYDLPNERGGRGNSQERQLTLF